MFFFSVIVAVPYWEAGVLWDVATFSLLVTVQVTLLTFQRDIIFAEVTFALVALTIVVLAVGVSFAFPD